MTTKPKAKKYRIRRNGAGAGRAAEDVNDGVGNEAEPMNAPTAARVSPPVDGQLETPSQVNAQTDINAIRQEGLTGRQLRMARRVAQKQGLAVTSDFDAVRQLRAQGIDPFQRNNILELVGPDQAEGNGNNQGGGARRRGPNGQQQGRAQLPQTVNRGGGNQLPQAIKPQQVPSTEVNPGGDSADERAGEIRKIQREIAGRRRRKMAMLFARLAVFVTLPTFIVGWYFATIATPMYATHAEFSVQKSESAGGGAPGIGGLLQGTGFGSQQEAAGVQSFLQSRDAMLRLDAEHGFIEHFSNPDIDAIQRLPEDATNEQAYALYQDHVKIGYDPSSGGLLKMEVIAASPEASQVFSDALIAYAEEMVDEQTVRLRTDQMADAHVSLENAENRRREALEEWLSIQQELEVLDSVSETQLIVQQIADLETRRLDAQLELNTFLSVPRPNEARVNALRANIANIESEIELKREQIKTTNAPDNTRLRIAEENYSFQTLMVQQALQGLETARIEANRQITYLTQNVRPVAPDSPSYPRVFENTVLAFLVFAGIYLMVSLTASILREQVSS